jgi:hypothetical protein
MNPELAEKEQETPHVLLDPARFYKHPRHHK